MKIACSIAGFSGEPVTLLGLLDSSGVLVVSKKVRFAEAKPGEDFSMVSNLDLADIDFRYTDSHMADAIQTYFKWKSQGMLSIDNAVQRYAPDNRIERDKISQTGPDYRIHPDIDNGQIGVLAMVAYAARQSSISAAMGAAREMLDDLSMISI